MSIFVFFHVGDDISHPAMLVESILHSNSGSKVIQCTDHISPVVPGVGAVKRLCGDISKLMVFRLKAFSELALTEPAIYLDTDMLVLKKIEIKTLIKDKSALMCERFFHRSAMFNIDFKGLGLVEYQGKTIGDIYPIVACATISKSYVYWSDLTEILAGIDEKFHYWYGDQEAMRLWTKRAHSSSFGFLSEAIYACLPEEKNFANNAKILHFKGAARKPLMRELYKRIFPNETSGLL
jgi:hypothetical protein